MYSRPYEWSQSTNVYMIGEHRSAVPRPSINEDIIETIREIHRTKQGEAAGNFQEALDTVVQLAIEGDEELEHLRDRSQGWEPGKYAGMIISEAARDLGLRGSGTSTRSRRSMRTTQTGSGSLDLMPDESAIFKARLDDEHGVTIPSAEADALGFGSGDILQVIAYKMEDQSKEQS